ncbi:MAG TPA: type II secretion system protein [Candidatus Saccharimonadales bacterium]|nr:type II secretion system protein [Candidatus Saccharimonadales bacterium]
MLKQLKTRNQKGFTIIEVLIVLAIAGLIMVVVFLAVPALQRSQRNQSRKTDANNLLSAIADFTGNNGGTPPASQTDINTATSNTKFGYFKAVNVFYGTTPTATVSASSTTPAADTNTTEEINIYVGKICTSATTAATATGANSRNVAMQYVVEQASGNGILQCVSS